MIKYAVYKGEYPFTEMLGVVEAPEDKPEEALKLALQKYPDHPVVQPITEH